MQTLFFLTMLEAIGLGTKKRGKSNKTILIRTALVFKMKIQQCKVIK
jgi:hypothetical protein